MNVRIPAEILTVEHLMTHPVWQFINDDLAGDALVQPATNLPVGDLDNRIVGCQVVLANTTCVWSLLGNIDANDARSTAHFLSLSVFHANRIFHLARYHDVDYERNGPAQLAAFLGLGEEDVFPIRYDVTMYAHGDPRALRGVISAAPSERLSTDELIKMALR